MAGSGGHKRRAIKLNPFEARAHFYNAVANLNLKNVDEAEKSAREAVKLDTRHDMPKANHILGMVLYMKQDFTGAAESIRDYLKYAPNASDAETARKQVAELEKIQADKTAATQAAQQ